ncbi:MAG: sigma-70 family RNA polymerase sigma factor [Bryobacteraceae bacterium]|nr:sigma-70 family RNA polymerase sigma factor [Bryobacteraceae bacterium]
MADDGEPDRERVFSRLLEAYAGPLRRLCAAYMHDPSDRQDLFQEIALALWTAWPRFRAASSERTWLYRVAHNVSLTYASKRRRQRRSEQTMQEAIPDPAGQDATRRLALLQAVRQLEAVDRQLALLYLEGLSAREMEEVTGLTANNIGVRLTRLRRRLACALEANGGSK